MKTPVLDLLRSRIVTLTAIGACSVLASGAAKAQTFYSHGEPTADEQFILELMNSARGNPAAAGEAYASTRDPFLLNAYRFYGVDTGLLRQQFSSYAVRPPLAFHPALIAAARRHTADMVAHNFQDHTGTDGSDATSRARDAGYLGSSGDNVCGPTYGPSAYDSYQHVEDGFLVDWGVPLLGHRLGTLEVSAYYNPVEIGLGCGAGYAVTQAFGFYIQTAPPRYLTGVAYRDLNGNGRYDQGEAITGVTITVDGNSRYTVTSQSGGFAVPLDRTGDFVARASGGTLGGTGLIRAASTAGENVKWDLVWAADGTPPKGVVAAADTVVSVAGDAARSGFVVSRTGNTAAKLRVSYHVGGAAIGGTDYEALTGYVTIPAGQSEVLIPIRAYTDHAKVKVFLDAAGYQLGKAQSKLLLANLR